MTNEEMKSNQLQGESIIGSFLRSYREKAKETTDKIWLDQEFAKYPELWKSEEERRATVTEVAESVSGYREASKELSEHMAAGHSRESYIQKTIETSCAGLGTAQVGQYATGIDAAIQSANEQMAHCLYCHNPDGSINFSQINQNPNLDGLIAENHHAGTFNIDASVKESEYVARALKSNGKNSVDLQIYDANGKVVRRYQSKYGADAERTDDLFDHGDYRGQQKLGPEEQVEQIPGAKDHIEAPDGTRSEGLSKEQAKEMQRKTQEEKDPPEYDWSKAGTGEVCRAIGKKALVAGAIAVGFQGARIIGRRIWNAITGKENQSVAEDLKEFVESAVKSGAAAAGTVAIAGGAVVVCKKGLLGTFCKSAKSSAIATAACAAVENIKIIGKLGMGEITPGEALDLAGSTNCALAGSIILAGKGGAIGATLGAALGPVGAAVGGFVGSMVGAVAGSTIGQAIYAGAKAIGRAVCSAGKAICRGIAKVASKLNPLNWF